MLMIKHNGRVYTNIISGSVSTSIGTMCGSFSITTSAGENEALPIRAGDRVEILADFEPICNGYVDAVSVSYDDAQHTITLVGRDVTQDIVDSSVGKRKEFKGGVTLQSVIQSVMSDLGISGIKIINKAGNIPAFATSEVTSAKIGENAFEFIERYARKRQVLVTTDGSGNIILLRGGGTKSDLKLLNLKGDREKKNNVLSASYTFDISKRYSKYSSQAQGNPLFAELADTAKVLTSTSATSSDSGVRSSRYLEFEAGESMPAADLANRVKWEANLRRAKSLAYQVIVQGHTFNKKTWRFNELVDVVDEFCDLSASLLISSVDYLFSLEEGSTSSMSLTYPDAFTLEENLSGLESKTNKTGNKFSDLVGS